MNNSLQVGDPAPDFAAQDQSGVTHTLAEYREKWLVLYFYPKDNTPGCIKEACSIRDNYADVKKLAVIFGVSGDSVKSHKGFADKYNLPFLLLSDPEKKMIEDYGANGDIFNKRATFIIDPEGKIAKIYPKVKADSHAPELVADLKELQA
ncbi:MAG: peroxiredoxin [Anaerolineales bacterium]|jgi:peroxiredoxin Q/BCP